MDTEFFKLLGAFVSGGLMLGLGHYTAILRERAAFARQDRKDRAKDTRDAYVRAIMVLDRSIMNMGIGTREDQEALLRWKAELTLRAPS